MSAYIVLDIEVTDSEGYAAYKELAAPTVAAYGGRYLVRGGKNETLEGEWHARRLVILEFPSVDRAKAWLVSPEYAPAHALRQKYARSKTVVVEGV